MSCSINKLKSLTYKNFIVFNCTSKKIFLLQEMLGGGGLPPAPLLFTALTTQPPKRRKRSGNISWFDPSFSSNVKTNIGKILLRLLDKHFPKDHKYYKLFKYYNHLVSCITYDQFYDTPFLACLALFGSLVPIMCNRTTCTQMHQLPRSHCGGHPEGTLFINVYNDTYLLMYTYLMIHIY